MLGDKKSSHRCDSIQSKENILPSGHRFQYTSANYSCTNITLSHEQNYGDRRQ